MKQPQKTLFSDNPYPGRGLILGVSKSGLYSVAAYFIMGRSEKSRARRLSGEENGVSIEILDDALTDDKLRVYRPVIKAGGTLIVSNGTQSDLLASRVSPGHEYDAFRDILNTISFEPDKPHFTPRILGLIKADGSHIIGIASRLEKASYEYEALKGIGHMIYTYLGDEDPLPSFFGHPPALALPDSPEELADTVWQSLNPDNRVSLYVGFKGINTLEESELIYNRY